MKQKIVFFCMILSIQTLIASELTQYNSDEKSLNYFITINSNHIIDKINYHTMALKIASEYELILKDYNSKIYFETLLGITLSSSYDFNSSLVQSYGTLGFKFNLFNPKIPRIKYIIARIDKLNEYKQYSGYSLLPQHQQKITDIQTAIKGYEKKFISRIGVGIGFPFLFTNLHNSSYLRTIKNINFENSFCFVSVDIKDFFSTYIGTNIKIDTLFVGMALDVSTPVYTLGTYFFRDLATFLGLQSSHSTL